MLQRKSMDNLGNEVEMRGGPGGQELFYYIKTA